MTTPAMSGEQLVELLELVEGSDTVELKLTIDDDDIQPTTHALGFDPLDSEIRQVVFFDTPDLALNEAGVVVRARRIQGGAGDTVIKLRPVTPTDLSPDLRRSKHLHVETDAMPGGFVCSASMKGKTTAAAVRDVIRGRDAIKGLFSKMQRAFFKMNAPDGLKLNALAVLGPIFVLKLKSTPEGFDRALVAELWVYPDNSRILELSTKCLPGEAFQVAAEAQAELTRRGVDLSSEQHTKTKTALEYFSSLLEKE
jgi:hypothetical protein